MGAAFSLPFSCAAMYFARHSAKYDLIADILERDFMPVARTGRLSAEMRVLLAKEVAGIYSEHGMHRESLRLYQLILDARGTPRSEATARTLAAVLRRKATSIIAEHGRTPTSDSLLKEARDSSPHSENLAASIANTVAWGLLSQGSYSKVVDVLGPLHKKYSSAIFSPGGNVRAIAVTAWNAAEVFHSYGIATGHLGKKYQTRSDQALAYAATIYRRSGTFPFSLRPGFWEAERRVHHDAADRTGTVINLMPRLPPAIDRLTSELSSLLRCP